MFSNKRNKYSSKIMLIYGLLCLLFILLSLLGLIWKDWEIVLSMASGSLFGAINLLLLLKSANGVGPDEKSKTSTISIFAALSAVRFIFMILAIGLPVLVIWLTMPDPVNKVRYYNIIAAGLPFIFTSIVTAVVKPEDNPALEKEKEPK